MKDNKEYQKKAFVGGLLIDGKGGQPVPDSLVIINGKKIEYAGVRKELEKVENDTLVYDITGKTIMPGLIDTHLHYSGNLSDNDTEWVLEPVFQKAVVAVAQAREALENGITSAGEISRFGIAIRDMIEKGVIIGLEPLQQDRALPNSRSWGFTHATPRI